MGQEWFVCRGLSERLRTAVPHWSPAWTGHFLVRNLCCLVRGLNNTHRVALQLELSMVTQSESQSPTPNSSPF